MSAKRSRFFGKILTGFLTTVVAPAVASLVAQQVGEWQDTVKCLIENQPPAITADGTRLTSEDKSHRPQAGYSGRSSVPPASLLPPVRPSPDWSPRGLSNR